MNKTREELMGYLMLAGILLMGYLMSALLGYFMAHATATGLGFFLVCVASYFVFRKKSRVGVLEGVGLSLLMGLLSFVGELLLSRN